MFCDRVAAATVVLVAAATLTIPAKPVAAAPAAEASIWNPDVPVPEAWESTAARGDSDEGSSPSISSRRVIGSDDRIRTVAPLSYPARTTAFVVATDTAGQQRACTGFMYGPRSLATSAHCLLSESGWNTRFHIFPAVDGGAAPFGHCGWVKATVDPRFVTDRSTRFDLGALQLDCTVGETIGWLRPGPVGSVAVGDDVTATGYPLDKFPSEMWTARGSVTAKSVDIVDYDVDTAEGQSGSPVVVDSDPSTAIAVHSSGFSTFNTGTVLTATQSAALLHWSTALPLEDTAPSFGSS